MPIYETGHARNVQHFQEMISFVTSWGAPYAPTNAAISVANLNAKLTDANTAMAVVTSNLAAYKAAVNTRETAFEGLRKLTTRVLNYYKSTGTASNNIDNVVSVKRKIDGKRAETVEDDPSTPENEAANSVSASQQSYTQLVEHFNTLIELVSGDPLYNPAEGELKVLALMSRKTAMADANGDVINLYTPLSNQRGLRDDVFYASGTGLVDLAQLVKNYTKAAFGIDSTQFNQIKGLTFSRPNK
jgi:hypothetical protein